MSAKWDEASPFHFGQAPPQIAHVDNFFWYNMVGNIAFISFSGAHGWESSQAHFEEACSWADKENPSWVVLLGHWDVDNLGCRNGMAAPEVYDHLKVMPGCQRFGSRIKFFEGHVHSNHVVRQNTGFMVGSFGQSGSGDFGLPILDTRDEKAVLYYFKLGQGGRKLSTWDTVMCCIKSKGLSGCRHHADVWLEQSLDLVKQSLDFAEQSPAGTWANNSRVEFI